MLNSGSWEMFQKCPLKELMNGWMQKQAGSPVDMKILLIVLVKQCQNDHHTTQDSVIKETPGRISATRIQENKTFHLNSPNATLLIKHDDRNSKCLNLRSLNLSSRVRSIFVPLGVLTVFKNGFQSKSMRNKSLISRIWYPTFDFLPNYYIKKYSEKLKFSFGKRPKVTVGTWQPEWQDKLTNIWADPI